MWKTREPEAFDAHFARGRRHARQRRPRLPGLDPAAIDEDAHAVEAQRRHHLVTRPPMAQLVVEIDGVLVRKAPARGDMLHDVVARLDFPLGNLERRRVESLLELRAESALFIGAARLPVTERDAGGGG